MAVIYKLKMSIYSDDSDEDLKTVWEDFYLDVESIIGFRVPDLEFTKKRDQGCFVYIQGDVFVIKSEPHIMKYLVDKFVNKAIESLEDMKRNKK